MTKITNELLEDYAMLYPRIECVKLVGGDRIIEPFEAVYYCRSQYAKIEYIQLRSIDSITDEECKKFFAAGKGFVIDCYRENKGIFHFSLMGVLKMLGIATPTIDKEGNIITVDELIESGKLKLI